MNKIISTLLGLFVVVVVVWGVWRMTPSNAPTNKPTTQETFIAEPVVYDVSSWVLAPKSHQLDTLMAHLGVATTDKAIDFYGNPATSYRYTARYEAPLYLVVGQDVIEVVWYYATAKDDTVFKTQSKSHAKKVYALVTAIYGIDGQALMQAILSGKPSPKLTGLIDARCRDYQCRLVIDAHKLGITTTKV